MAFALTRLSVILVLAALALPSVGTLLDHHYAERQPGHLHVGMSHYHVHASADRLTHVHDRAGDMGGGAQSVAIHNYETGTPATMVVAIDVSMNSFLQFEPASLFALPMPPEASPKQNVAAPPDKPPRHLV